MSTVVEELVAVFGFDVDERALRRANQGVRRTEQAMERASRASSRMGAGLQGALLAWVGLDQMARQFGGLVDANAQMDDLTAAMVLATGSAESAESAMSWIADFSARSPDQIQEVTEAFQMLQQQGLDPMDGRLVALGNTAAALQTPISELMNATAGAAIGNLERLERMLVRYGYSLTSTDGVIRGMASGEEFVIGEGFASIERFLVQLGEGRFANQMERRAETINGALSMLRDAVFQFRTSIGDSDFNEALVNLIGALEQLFRNSGDGAVVIGRVLAGALNMMARALVFVDTHMAAVMAGIAWLGGSVAIGGLIALGSALTAAGTAGMIAMAQLFGIPLVLAGVAVLLALVAEDFYRFANGQESVIGRLAKRYPEIVEPLKEIIKFVRDLIEYGPEAFRLMAEDVDALTEALDRALGKLGRFGDAISVFLPQFSAARGDGFDDYMDRWRNLWGIEDEPEGTTGSIGSGPSRTRRSPMMWLSDMARGTRTVEMGGQTFQERPVEVSVVLQAEPGEPIESQMERAKDSALNAFEGMGGMFRLLPGAQ